jgi:hypothetical protein
MRRHIVPVLLLLAVAVAPSCSSRPAPSTIVPDSPFGGNPPATAPVSQVSFARAPVEVAARVDQVGQKIVQANTNQFGRHNTVQFFTVGTQEPTLMHRTTGEVIISEGLVRRCLNDDQLAAVLAFELGRLVSEREALASVAVRRPDREPPIEVRVGNDNAGTIGAADMTRQAELAKFAPPPRGDPSKPLPPPDPRALATVYLRNAGVPPGTLDAVAALLQPDVAAPGLQKQLLATLPATH